MQKRLETTRKTVSTLERIESIKAGILGMSSFTFCHCFFLVIKGHLTLFWFFSPDLIFKILIALITGGLFGLTYRYIIRGEDNTHLKDGAVLAFGLVRGLASLESTPHFLETWQQSSLILGESCLCFFIARLTLDWAFMQGWVSP